MNNVLNDFLENHHNEFGELRMDIQLEAFPSNFLCPEIGGNKLNENDMESLCGAIRNKQIHSIKPI